MKRWLFFLLLTLPLVFGACGRREPFSSESSEGQAWTESTEELSLTRDGQHIAGMLYLPAGQDPAPLIVLCHGFGGSMKHLQHYAESFQKEGYAAAIFDFIGGGPDIESDGDMTEMSVLTEQADIGAVIGTLKGRAELDFSRLFLVGASQGGFVTTAFAGDQPAAVKGMILLYPGFGMQDYVRAVTKNGKDTAETYVMLGQTVGRRYVEDALSFAIEDRMRAYPGPVMILHGTADYIAPITYSRRSLQFFPQAELISIEGAGHGFRGEADEETIGHMLEYLKKQTENQN